MPKIEVKRVQASQTLNNMEPHWEAIVDYGGHEVTIPLPGRFLTGDDWAQQRREFVESLERLAEALLAFADRTRERRPESWDKGSTALGCASA